MVDEKYFLQCAAQFFALNWGEGVVALRRFRALFGVSPACAGAVWGMLQGRIMQGALPLHLLWGLHFLKHYSLEAVNALVWRCDEKTHRKWSWYFVHCIAHLPIVCYSNVFKKFLNRVSNFLKICWDSRLKSHDYFDDVYCSVDGTDCRINEPFPFSGKWFSHKFNGPGVRYEIGVSVADGEIIWCNGPFPCGQYPDISIFKEKMVHFLLDHERVIADSGYGHVRCICPNNLNDANRRMHSIIRARHETVNERVKNFNSVRSVFRHSLDLHGAVFHAVVRLTALMIRTSDPLFQI